MAWATIEARMDSMMAGRCPDCGGELVELVDDEDQADELLATGHVSWDVEAFCTRCDWRGMYGGST